MTFETLLNLVWASVGITGLGLLACSELRNRNERRPQRWRRILAVVFAILVVFPCVSASDDIVSLNALSHRTGDDRPSAQLERFFGALQSVQPAMQFQLLFALSLFGLAVVLRRPVRDRYLVCDPGRAPPAA